MTDAPARPTLAKKRTRETEGNRKQALEQGVRITIDGESYEVRHGDLTGLYSARLRRESGYSFRRLTELMDTDPDLDVIGTVVWLARVVRGDAVSLDEVLAGLGYGMLNDDEFDVQLITDPEEVDPADPEA